MAVSGNGRRAGIAAIVIVALAAILFSACSMAGCFTGPGPGPEPAIGGIETFTMADGPVCTQDGKPVVRLFSTTWCPHCKWVNDGFNSVMKEYADAGKIIAYHWELDTKDDVLTPFIETSIPDSELSVYNEFNPGGSIPTFVFGCKYYRIGTGYESQNDIEKEKAEFRGVIEELLSA
jgi:thiol-disulfide isomerase/thioredoxin